VNALPTVAITLFYVAPLALLALLLSGRGQRHPAWLLTLILVALPIFYIGHYLMLQELKGWPSGAELPERFRLLAFDIIEPDPGAADPGRILLWVEAGGETEPRVYTRPYRKRLHQDLVAAGKQQQQGRPQIGSKTPQGRASSTTGAQDEQVIRFEDAISKPLPAKH
jgi:hypothetical protein